MKKYLHVLFDGAFLVWMGFWFGWSFNEGDWGFVGFYSLLSVLWIYRFAMDYEKAVAK